MMNDEKSISIEKPIQLIVEGKDERLFFDRLIKDLRLPKIQILPIGGKTKLKRNLKALVKSPGFDNVTSLAIVRDANSNHNSAFQSVCNALSAVNLPSPESPLMSVGDRPQITVMIMPGDNSPGMLEDLCLKALAETPEDPALMCIRQYFDCLQQRLSQFGLPFPRSKSKSMVQAFLASKEKFVKCLGEAAQKRYWPFDKSAFDEVKNFLRGINI